MYQQVTNYTLLGPERTEPPRVWGLASRNEDHSAILSSIKYGSYGPCCVSRSRHSSLTIVGKNSSRTKIAHYILNIYNKYYVFFIISLTPDQDHPYLRLRLRLRRSP
jgi:hypothetical protein